MLQYGEVLQELHCARAGNSVTEGSCSAPGGSSASTVGAPRLHRSCCSPLKSQHPLSPQDSHLIPKSSICMEAAVPGESILICTQIVYFKSVFLIRSFFLLYYYVSSKQWSNDRSLWRICTSKEAPLSWFYRPTYVENICGGVITLTWSNQCKSLLEGHTTPV